MGLQVFWQCSRHPFRGRHRNGRCIMGEGCSVLVLGGGQFQWVELASRRGGCGAADAGAQHHRRGEPAAAVLQRT